MTDAAPLAELRRTAAALKNARAAYNNALIRQGEHEAKSRADERRLADFQARDESFRVAFALGDAPAPLEFDAADLEALRIEIAANARVKLEFDKRVAAAKAQMTAADETYRASARSHLAQVAVEPARAKVLELLEQLGTAAGDLMAAHYVANVLHGTPGAWVTGSSFGAADELLRHIAKFDSWDWQGSIRPSWAPKSGSVLSYRDTIGVPAAERRYANMLDEASA